MATYPTLPTSYGSDPKPINGISIDRAEDGSGRVRSFHTSDKVSLPRITHPWLSSADKSTLESFYTTNRLLPFDYVSPADSVSRSCVFAAPIQYERQYGNFWTAIVEMEQV